MANNYNNLFDLRDWAASSSNGLSDSSAVLSVDATAGRVTVKTANGSAYTAFAEGVDCYLVQVTEGETLEVAWTMSGTSSDSGMRYVPLGADFTYRFTDSQNGDHSIGLPNGRGGPGSRSCSLAVKAGWRYIQLVFAVYSANKTTTFGNVRVLRPTVFGRGCGPIEVAPFTPVCSRPDIRGTTAMTLEVPAPVFAPAIPPEDCVCFEFKKGSTSATVNTACADPTLQLDISITPDAADCCSGKYTIVPTVSLDVPCVPFTPAEGPSGSNAISVKSRSGKTAAEDIDGKVNSLRLVRGPGSQCCEVWPVIDIALPDCVKQYKDDPLPEIQIVYCERVNEGPDEGKTVTRSHQLLEMFQDRDNCSLYPRLKKPLVLPCCTLPDIAPQVITRELTNSRLGNVPNGLLKVTFSRTDCQPNIEVEVTPITMPVIPPPACLHPVEVTFNATYEDENGNTATTDDTKVTFDNEFQNGCLGYENKTVTLDLKKIKRRSFGSGGAAFQDDSDKNLYIDGAASDSKTYYGGGLGNFLASGAYAKLPSDKPLRRRGDMNPCDMGLDSGEWPVPYVTCPSKYWLVTVTGDKSRTWTSTRKSTETIDEVSTNTKTAATGNLDMILPSGFQWDSRGLALNLSRFLWNGSGTLSEEEELEYAAVVSPGARVFADNANVNGQNVGKSNASGLCTDTISDGTYSAGIRVDNGPGLRIYGVDNPGDITSSTLNRLGQLEVYAHSDDFKFNSDGKMVLNDNKSANEVKAPKPISVTVNNEATTAIRMQHYSRGTDYTFPVVMAATGELGSWLEDTTNTPKNYIPYANSQGEINGLKGLWDAVVNAKAGGSIRDRVDAIHDLIQALYLVVHSLRVLNVHVGEAGMLTGIDPVASSSSIERHYVPPSSTTSGS